MDKEELIARFESEMAKVKRPGIDKLMDYIRKSDFYTAPASTKFHLSCESGLLQHSLNVLDALRGLLQEEQTNEDGTKAWFYTVAGTSVAQIKDESVILIALLHDICKTYFYSTSTRNVKNEKTGKWEKVPFYTVNDLMPLGHGPKSAMLIKNYIKLTSEEMYAIWWHMGFTDQHTDTMSLAAAIQKYPIVWALPPAAMMASCLQAAGYRVGLYTSPFINRFNERIQINGQQIPDETLVELVEQVKPAADAMEDVPTEFEIITALGMLYFAQQQCDIVVLEVGLGGTLDSTNVIEKPACAVITALGMDHVKELGPTLADIATAKAGIIKPGCPVVGSGGAPEADAVLRRVAAQQLPQALLRGEAQAGGADLRAEVLSVEGLVRRHAQQIERGFLPVAQKQVLAYGHVQYAADLGAQLHVEGGVMADAVVFDAQLVQQVEGCGLLWQQLALRTGVMGYGGDGHCASPRFSSSSPAR